MLPAASRRNATAVKSDNLPVDDRLGVSFASRREAGVPVLEAPWDDLEVRLAEQMDDVHLLAGEKIVQTNDVVSLLDQPFAKMRPKKAGPASH